MNNKERDLSQALEEINENGFIEISNLFNVDLINSVNQKIERPLNSINANGRKGYVQSGNIRFLANTLSWGRNIIDLYTNPFLISLCNQYSGSDVHLSNYRIYRTLPSKSKKHIMNWHLDNKTDVYDFEKDEFITKVVPMDKGIIMIMYLSDVEDGGLQLVKGSHKWQVNETQETWDHEEEQFKDKIITFNNRKRGTIIIYDYKCIHRAKPYQTGGIRTSLFAQYSPNWMPVGEPILLNARDISDLTEEQKRVLNFGKDPTTENWPIGKKTEVIQDLQFSEVMKYLVKKQLAKFL